MDVKKLSDEKLVELILKYQDSPKDAEIYNEVALEYTSRNAKKEQQYRDQLLFIAKNGTEKIIDLLEFIIKKPVEASLITIIIAVLIGVLVNFFSALFLEALNLNQI